jgi:methylmalonyl-CoA/ethylmalonyl-CoA epimerase
MSSPTFGPVIQHAFVVRDMDAGLAYWTEVMGVGPFYRVEKATYREALYRGAPASPEYSVAIAYWGDAQIELVSPTSDNPSIYKEFLDEGHDGLLHHMCVTVENMGDFKSSLDGDNFETLAELALEPEGHVLYLRGSGQRWPLMEVGDFPQGIYDFFDMVKTASVGWDGKDPIRNVESL